MDAEMLSLVLDDRVTYQGATKSVLIGKLEEVFKKFKSKGNTELSVLSGICGSEFCSNQGCKGFSFLGNVSEDYLSLVIEEENGNVTNINHCLFMRPEEGTLEKYTQIYYTIHTDDEASFVPDVDYSILQLRCEESITELKVSFDNRLCYEDCIFWLSKYNELRKNVFKYYGYGGFIIKFRTTYDEIKHVTSFFCRDREASFAINEFNGINPDDEEQMLLWLVKYEKFGLDLGGITCQTNFDFIDKIENGLIPLWCNDEIWLIVEEYQNILNFLEVFNKYYWQYVKLYANNLVETTGNENSFGEDILYLKKYLESRSNQL